MRQYAWYSPELNVITLQTIIEGCQIVFEWEYLDILNLSDLYDPIQKYTWVPLGEL